MNENRHICYYTSPISGETYSCFENLRKCEDVSDEISDNLVMKYGIISLGPKEVLHLRPTTRMMGCQSGRTGCYLEGDHTPQQC